MCSRTAGSAVRPGSIPNIPKMPHMSGAHVKRDGAPRRRGGTPSVGHRGQGDRESADIVEVEVVRDRMEKPGNGERAEADLNPVCEVLDLCLGTLVSDLSAKCIDPANAS